jgi:leader peptidase (prepilin peptidase)/N-methyltransferase
VSPDTVIGALAGIFGLIMGSGVTALAHRVPRGQSWVRGRSACASCGHVLGAADLIPLLSWLLARGRCRHCGAVVSFRYPLTELLCAAWAVLLWWRVGLTVTWPLLAIWGFLLIALLWVDLDFQLLPDVLTLPGALVGVAASLLGPGPRHALLGMVAGAGLLWLVGELYFRARKVEGMGFGDVKLAAMFGAVLGAPLTILAIFLGSFAGALVGAILMARGEGGMKTALPFGVFLAPAAMIAFLWGDGWLNAYFSLFPK